MNSNEDENQLVPTSTSSNPDYSTMDSDQLDEKITSLVTDLAQSDTDALETVLPYIQEMQKVLSERSEMARKKSDISFSAWLTGTVKRLKGSVDKGVVLSRRTIYRRLAKMAGHKNVPKPLKPGTEVRDKGTGLVARVIPASSEMVEGQATVSFEDEDGKRASGVWNIKDLTVLSPRKIEIGALLECMDMDGGTVFKYDGKGKFTKKTGTLTGNKRSEKKAEADQVKKDKKKHATGATNPVGGKPGQVSDAAAKAKEQRHHAKPVTPAVVKPEDRAAVQPKDDKGNVIPGSLAKDEVLTEPKKRRPGRPKKVLGAVPEVVPGLQITQRDPVTGGKLVVDVGDFPVTKCPSSGEGDREGIPMDEPVHVP
jgi:hypothetical protein